MIVSGLNSNRFLTGNPIPITITADSGEFAIGTKITMSITRQATHPGQSLYAYPPITLFPNKNGVTINLGSDNNGLGGYIKGMMPEPYIPTNSYQDPVPNYQVFNFSFSENQTDTSAIFSNKTFIRAFKRTKSNNALTFSVNEELREGEKIPVWQGYPTARFWINGSNQIQSTTVVTSDDYKQMRTPTACNPFYVRFLNSKGGYSFWMFNAWQHGTKSKELGVIERTGINNKSLGFSEENTVTVDTRVKREYYDLIRALIVSPVIQVYDQFDMEWLKIELKGTTFETNNYDDLQEFTCEFDLMLNVNPGVIW